MRKWGIIAIILGGVYIVLNLFAMLMEGASFDGVIETIIGIVAVVFGKVRLGGGNSIPSEKQTDNLDSTPQ